MNQRILKVAVVGHTNTGKTSLLRTLTRDACFGEVSDRPATTRHVEGAALLVDNQPLIELYDTPGLEDSISLLDWIESNCGASGPRRDGVEQINAFLQSPEAHGRFAQEAKAIRQVMASDVALYVVDARDRVLGKHRDELAILARCARPIVPVLNFTACPEAQTALWRDHLSRANHHAVAEFDTVVVDEESERRLFEKMRSLLDQHRQTIDLFIEHRQRQREQLVAASADLLADLLIDVAALEVIVPMNAGGASNAAVESLKQRVRDREQACVERLLGLHRFRVDDVQSGDLPLADGRWGTDLFNPAAMKQFGIRTGSAAAAGAMVGLTIDAMVGGMSLGAATAVGAAVGALLGTGHAHGRRIVDRLRGFSELRCDDATLRLLLARQMSLIRALLRRGHASMKPIQLGDAQAGSAGGEAAAAMKLPDEVSEARIRPQWSRLADRANPMAISSVARQTVQNRLAMHIAERLRG